MPNDLVIVYGTLRLEAKTEMSKLLQEQARFIGTGYVLGQLYEVDGFPGAITSNNPNDKVFGDVFEINPELLEALDNYEECSAEFPEPHEYTRQKVTLYLADNTQQQGWVYLYNRSTDELFHIQSGDYLKYQKNTIG